MWKYFACVKIIAFLAIISNVCGGNPNPSKNDYCTKPCIDEDKKKLEHTACKCKKVEKDHELVDTDIVNFRQGMLDTHNRLRNEIASGKTPNYPNASNMNAVSYDMELEYISRCFAKKFNGDHDKCRDRFNGQYVLQNLAGSSIQKYDVNKLAAGWFSEYSDATVDDIRNFTDTYRNNKAIGHFTVFVWATMDRLGCARVWIPTNKQKSYKYALICNYASTNGRAPNMEYSPVYLIGEPCSKCHAKANKCGEDPKYPALCGKILPVPTGPPSLATRNTHIISLMTLFAIFLIYDAIK